jgi:YHS domain-containing protein
MTVNPAIAKYSAKHAGNSYFFCGARCLERFTANPEHCLAPAPVEPPPSAVTGTTWTCPMHPEVVNDAPALAQAQIGIAMGNGTDVAMESAAVTLLKGDLGAILRARRLSRATMRNIRQNLFFAFVFNAASVPIAAGVLYPFTGLLLNPMIASGVMSLSSVLVVSNALRLRAVRL